MKLVFFIPKFVHCGPTNVVLNNIEEIVRLNPDIRIAMISYRDNLENDNFKSSCEDLGINEFYSLSVKNNFFQKYLYLKQITRNFDIIHSNGFFPDLYNSILSSHIVKISTAHSIISKDYPATYGIIKGSLYAMLHHIVYLNTSFDNIIGCSNVVTEHIQKHTLLNKNKLHTIHNGINHHNFKKLNSKEKTLLKNKIFESLSIQPDESTKVFVYSGRLTRLKRVPELINWFLELASTNSILIILGDGEERRLCEESAKDAKNIYFLGHVNETVSYYQVADYVVSNSSLEGFPMGILEGMSCGCVALLSDIPSHNEVIQYFPNMAVLLSNFEPNLISLSPTKKEFSYLSATRMSKQYMALYHKILKLKDVASKNVSWKSKIKL